MASRFSFGGSVLQNELPVGRFYKTNSRLDVSTKRTPGWRFGLRQPATRLKPRVHGHTSGVALTSVNIRLSKNCAAQSERNTLRGENGVDLTAWGADGWI